MTDKAEQALRMVREAPVIAFDTETSGLDWKRNFPIGYVVTEGSLSVYVPVRHGGGGNLPDPHVRPPELAEEPIQIHKFEKALAGAFEDRRRLGYLTVGHYMKFDAHFAANAGIMLGRNLCCTQNTEVLLDERSKQFSLGVCASRHGVQAKFGDELYQHIADVLGGPADRKSMDKFWQLPGNDDLAVEYAEGDGTSTLQLYHKQIKKIEKEELSSIFELENNLIWTLFRMERRGIKVNREYLQDLEVKIKDKVIEALEKMPEGFNVRSPVHMRAFMEDAGHTDWPMTDKGNPSFKEDWLKKTSEGRDINEIRKWTNLSNTFITPLLNKHIFLGRVHANLNQLKSDFIGTAARLSCSEPNLQAIPKRDKELAMLFRRAFEADEGFEFCEADWSQCEPRLFAHYSKDPKLVEGYLKEPYEDVHAIVANMLNVDRDVTAKRMNMGIFTGMGTERFSEHMKWPLNRATVEWNKWHQLFPTIRSFQNQAKSVLKSRGYVKTILGRRQRLDHPRLAYRGASKVIQGSNADIIKYKMLEIDRMFENDEDLIQLLMSVHDSIEWQAAENKKGEEASRAIIALMSDIQSDPFNLRVPFVVDYMSGHNWAEATFGGDN